MEQPEEKLFSIECKARVFSAAMYSLGNPGAAEIESKAFQQFAKEICQEIAALRKELAENWTCTRKGDADLGIRMSPARDSNIFSEFSSTAKEDTE